MRETSTDASGNTAALLPLPGFPHRVGSRWSRRQSAARSDLLPAPARSRTLAHSRSAAEWASQAPQCSAIAWISSTFSVFGSSTPATPFALHSATSRGTIGSRRHSRERAPDVRRKPCGKRGPRRCLFAGRNGIFQIHDHGIGSGGNRFRIAIRPIAGNEETNVARLFSMVRTIAAVQHMSAT